MVRDLLAAHDAGLCDASETLNVRCIELHTYQRGGGLTDPGHNDQGSVLTLSALLSPPQSGGTFTTTDAASGAVTEHALEKGDGVVICSEMVHNVTEVEEGTRQSLIIELWTQRQNRRDRFS